MKRAQMLEPTKYYELLALASEELHGAAIRDRIKKFGEGRVN
jgi:hypothetical protein